MCYIKIIVLELFSFVAMTRTNNLIYRDLSNQYLANVQQQSRLDGMFIIEPTFLAYRLEPDLGAVSKTRTTSHIAPSLSRSIKAFPFFHQPRLAIIKTRKKRFL